MCAGQQEVKLINTDDPNEAPGEASGDEEASSSGRVDSAAARAGAAGGAAARGEEEAEEEAGGAAVATSTSTTSTVLMEQALVDWGSRRRTRAKITLRIGHLPENGEVDVEVRRGTCAACNATYCRPIRA